MLGIYTHNSDVPYCDNYMRCGDGYEWRVVDLCWHHPDLRIGQIFSATSDMTPPYGVRRVMVCARKKSAPSLRTLARLQRIRNLAAASGEDLYVVFDDEGVAKSEPPETFPYPNRFLEIYADSVFRPVWE